MDEQRQEAYLKLIPKLINCSGEKRTEILKENLDLVDPGLIETIKQVAEVLTNKEDKYTANILLNLANQLTKVVGSPSSILTLSSQVTNPYSQQIEFVLEALAITNESNVNSQLLYRFFTANLDQLNEQLIDILPRIMTDILENIDNINERIYLARDLGNFSTLIREFPVGNIALNLEIAIIGYTIAFTVFSYEKFPDLWATLQNNLGNAYLNRIRDKTANNIEQAIKCYYQALHVHTYEIFPNEWAMTQTNLGNAYLKRIQGKKAKNIEQALHYYHQALAVYKVESFPQEWAGIHNHLGIAYSERILGDKADNLEKAINHYCQALLIYNCKDFPQEWAMTKNNLGIAYFDRILHNQAENLEKAIDCHHKALAVYTREAFPQKWASVKNHLGNSYSKRILGNRTDNLEQAINHYHQTLSLHKYQKISDEQWAMIHNNLGLLYFYSSYNAERLKRSISHYYQALKVYKIDTFPEKWARIQNHLGIAYKAFSKVQYNSARLSFINKSIKCCQKALQIYTSNAFPQDYIGTELNLGLIYQEANQLQLAHGSFKLAINAVESLRGEILSGDEARRKLAEQWNELYRRIALVCLQLDKSVEAIEYAERSKTRNLVELILTRDRHTIFPAEVVAQLDRLRDEIASGQYELQNATAEDPTALAQHLQQLRQQRNELQDRYLPIGSGFQFEQFRSTLSDRTAIVEFYITTDKLLVFIITKQTQQPIVLSPDLIDLNKLANWANSYLKAYSNKKSHWQRRLTTRLHLLAKILHIDEILQRIPTECDKLILIPHRYLHLLPLHALPLAGGSSLFDKFLGGVSYAPSCQLLQLAQNRQRPDFTRLFAVQNPTGDLSYTDIEVETIQRYFNTSNLLKQNIATKEAIDDASLTAVHCAHFSCHGYFNGSEPRKSALILANAELNSAPTQPDTENYLSLENGGVLDLNKCLTLDSVFTLNLEQCRLVTLSACETGLIDFRNTSDEYIGLPSGFLYAGASSVVSSLWTVNDLSTAFLMIRFYQNLQKGLAVGLALNQAQLWLKNLTKGDLEKWIEENQLQLKPAVRIGLRRRLYKLEDDAKPFQETFHWAGFNTIGQ
ncbi:CHAT domain-containing protein [Planktothrix paucivesiculata]|nr:CHAT domain-containing protein [Planktothrix paucivesiculata]